MGDFLRDVRRRRRTRRPTLLGLAVADHATRTRAPNAMPRWQGFPHPALESYLAKVGAGRRCGPPSASRSRTPRFAKGCGQARGRPRRLALATLTDDVAASIPARPISSRRWSRSRGKLGLSWVELSTGRVFALDRASNRARTGSTRSPGSTPAEILDRRDQPRRPLGPKALREGPDFTVAITVRPSWDFQPEEARQKRSSTSSSARPLWPGSASRTTALEVAAAGALGGVSPRDPEDRRSATSQGLSPYRRQDVRTMALDEMTRRSLELTRTLRERPPRRLAAPRRST